MEIRTIIARCQGCHIERTFSPDKPITTASGLKEWIDSGAIPRCLCGATHCDLKIPLNEIEKSTDERNQ